ncbi:hypothetical protein OAV62_02030 [bacterium]|nr:hypothetical protein [bacterium]
MDEKHLTLADDPADNSCPRCGGKINDFDTCQNCGVIVSKYLAKQAAQRESLLEASDEIDKTVRRSSIKQSADRPTRSSRSTLSRSNTIFVVSFIVLGCIVYFKNNVYRYAAPDFSLVGRSHKAQAAAEWVYQSATLGSAKEIEIEKLLKQHDYSQLESQLEDLVQDTKNDISYEMALIGTFYRIKEHRVNEGLILQWFEQTQSPYARAAIGIWAVEHSLNSYWICTPRCTSAQLASHTKEASRGAEHLHKAIEQVPDFLPASFFLIRADFALNVPVKSRRVFDEAMEFYPSSYAMRSVYIERLSPHWMRSNKVAAMKDFAEEQQEYLSDNPAIYALLGESHAAKLWMSKVRSEYHDGIKHAKKSA